MEDGDRATPVSHVFHSAHDMAREYTVISALCQTSVPVARPVVLCVDDAVNGAPFYLMEYVDGVVLRTTSDANASFNQSARYAIGGSLAETLAELHHVYVNEVGLDAMGRHDGYVQRQVRRWRSQYDQTVVDGAPGVPLIAEVADELLRAMPIQQAATVVLGDFRVDNTVLGPDGKVIAVLDWGICTIGDPVAHLGTLLCYRAEPGDAVADLLREPPTLAPGFMTRDELVRTHAERSSLDLSDTNSCLAFAYWRLACIALGVFARYRAGACAGGRSSVAGVPSNLAWVGRRA